MINNISFGNRYRRQKLRILVFSWRDPKHPLSGGAEQVVHEHAKGWIAKGHKVTLFASSIKGLAKKEILDGVEVVRKGYQYIGVQIAAAFYYLNNRSKFDFVIDQFHGLPFLTPLFVRKPKLAIIQETARGVWFLNPLPWPLNWLIGALGFLSEPLIFLFYKKVPFMTGSHSAKEDVAKFGIPKKNIVVVPHGVKIAKPKLKTSNSKIKTIVYLGILSKDKGIEDAIQCFSILNKLGKFRFWVIGKIEAKRYAGRIVNLVYKLNMRDKIYFWGRVSHLKKFELLSKAHILINPSIREGWGLVNIEANAVGTPVVAYKSPGLVDSVKEGLSGILCSENNPENLAKNILDLLSNKERYEKMKKNAKAWSKNFNWQKSRKLSLRLIERVINER